MLKPPLEPMVKNITTIYKNNITPGISLIKPTVKKNKIADNIYDPSDKSLINWSTKDYMYYFATQYFTAFNVKYQLSFESDGRVITQMQSFFKSFNIDHRFHTKKIIDWGFDNYDIIIKQNKFLTLPILKKYLNEYIQLNILELKSDDNKKTLQIFDFVGDLNQLYSEQKMLLALRKYGIPIVASYLENHKKHSRDFIIKNILKLEWSDEDLEKIAKASIIRSPYHKDMSLLDWRSLFKTKFSKISNSSWWRDVDYNGEYDVSYEELL